MKKNFFLIVFFCCSFSVFHLSAQTDTVINGKHYKSVEEDTKPSTTPGLHAKKKKPPVDSTFVINNKRLKYYNSWLSGGAGIQQNISYKRKPGFTLGVDYNFHLKQHYFQLGTFISGEKFGFYDNYQFHLGYGKRYEDKDFHGSGFIGISYSTGYTKVDSSGIYERPFKVPGIYIEGQFVKKITYDVGAGVSLFADWNEEQGILGAKFIIYFSGAYKGKKYAKE